MSRSRELPQYELIVNGESKFFPFGQAYVTYDSGFAKVEFGSRVIGKNRKVRKMTKRDRVKISDAADEYSGSK